MADHLLFKVTGFEIIGDWTLRVRFNDGTCQVIDFLPVLQGSLFAPLREKEFFAQVRLDPDWRTLVWPNGADFDPETLHNWPQYVEGLRAQRSANASFGKSSGID
jgi:hypothetical protein